METSVSSALRLGLFINEVIKTNPNLNWRNALSKEQIRSKIWLINMLRESKLTDLGNVMILGGWIGLLGYLLLHDEELNINYIRSFDVDPESIRAADDLNYDHLKNNWKFKSCFANWDLIDYNETIYHTHRYTDNRDIDLTNRFDTIINTCCEHMSLFSDWIQKIPGDRLLILQSNSNAEFEGHTNCKSSLKEFVNSCQLSRVLYSGELDLGLYKRWMIFGYK